MRGYTVRVLQSPRLRQRFHVRIESSNNGQVLFWSEKYRDVGYARGLARLFAQELGARYIDDTVGAVRGTVVPLDHEDGGRRAD